MLSIISMQQQWQAVYSSKVSKAVLAEQQNPIASVTNILY
jgi:hypothetical protein